MRDPVLRHLRQVGLVAPGDRVLVAVSGGADSVALLRVLLELRSELGIILGVAHLNHGLRGENSDADQAFVAELAARYRLEFFVERVRVAEHAEAKRMGLESAGRKLRYEWLTKVAQENRFDAVATAHTADDQAETVLMKFLRGAGTRGLAGIYPQMVRVSGEKGQTGQAKVRFIRPLLSTARSDIEAYLASLEQPWREDESNRDHRFRRNRIRHELLPLLEREYNPSFRQTLIETAEVNRGEETFWRDLINDTLNQLGTSERQLLLRPLGEMALALQRRVVKRFLEQQTIACDFQHVEAVRRCAVGELSRVELPGDWVASREGDCLTIQRPHPHPPQLGYMHQVAVPGEVPLPEIGCTLRIVPVPAAFADEAEPGTLLRADLMGCELWLRNWQPGDRYHVAYMSKPQKLKTLFQARKIAASERPLWPVLLKGTDIVWTRDLPVADAYCWRPGDGDGLRVECFPT